MACGHGTQARCKSGPASSDTMGDGIGRTGASSSAASAQERSAHPQPSARQQQQRHRARREAAAALRPSSSSATRHHDEPSRAAAAMRVESAAGAESWDADVDMGTPTAATNSRSDWREAARDGGVPAQDDALPSAWRTLREPRLSGGSPPTETTTHARQTATPEPIERRRRQTEREPFSDLGVVEIQAFREYSHDDIDSLDILPSQDYVGELPDESAGDRHGATCLSSQRHSSAWLDFRDESQIRDEEASEVFDNVIYAPPSLPPKANNTSPPSAATLSPNSLPPHHSSVLDDQYESESELSDGYDVPCAVFNNDRLKDASTPSPPLPSSVAPASVASPPPSSASGTPPLQWCARLSVKRDCSFIDHTLKHRRKPLSVQDLSESGEEFEEKLKLIDGDDDGDSEDNSCTAKSLASLSSSSIMAGGHVGTTGHLLPGFRPKKKRRKVRQLALDAFLKVQPGTTY